MNKKSRHSPIVRVCCTDIIILARKRSRGGQGEKIVKKGRQSKRFREGNSRLRRLDEGTRTRKKLTTKKKEGQGQY